MNNCHGKHDGKFCSGSNAGGGNQIKKGADDHFQQKTNLVKSLKEHQNMQRDKIAKSTDPHFQEHLKVLNAPPKPSLPLYYGNDSPAGTDAFGRDIKKPASGKPSADATYILNDISRMIKNSSKRKR